VVVVFVVKYRGWNEPVPWGVVGVIILVMEALVAVMAWTAVRRSKRVMSAATTIYPTSAVRAVVRDIRREVPLDVQLTETQLRGLLGMFGLSGEKVFQESGTLSGGEKTKLALAMLMVGKNNLLLLDEPTNNLDPPSRDAVASALVDWPGAIILVSHDEDFVRELAPTKVLLMPDGDVDYFSEEWLDLVSMS
jgi:ATPase subunit of ABC transporter with duplicated ATPase domains